MFAEIEMPAGRQEPQEVLQVSRLKIEQKPHCQVILDATSENFLEILDNWNSSKRKAIIFIK